MAESVVGFALEQICDLLSHVNLVCGVGDEVKALETQLREVKCLIEDADRRRHESKTVSNWIAEIIDLAYEPEAAIEECEVRVLSKRRRRGVKKTLHRYACIHKEFHSLRQLHSEISNITSELNRITKHLVKYGMRRIIDGGERYSASGEQSWRITFPEFEIEDCFVGMEAELDQLVHLLVHDENHRVISIWGMGGIGKTTIARKVYNQIMHTRNDRFDRFAWVCITQQCQTHSVLKGVVEQLDPQNKDEKLSLSSLVEKLCEIQRAKRCLIVLDDLWKVSDWNKMKHAFLVEDLQSKILVTTRRRDVAGIGFSVELGLLDEHHALDLLKKKAFPRNNIPDSFQENLHKIGKEMVQKCGYLPLAISVLGSVLSKKYSLTDWEEINKNINEYIYRADGQDEKENQIHGVLSLSYDDLPYHLKPCFLYLGILKEDESIEVNELYMRWIAQGMISSERVRGNMKTLKDIAESYLSELSLRCIVQVEVNDVLASRKCWTCKLHDVVREVCLSIGQNESFGVQNLKFEGGKCGTPLRKNTLYLAINVKGEQDGGGGEVTEECGTSKRIRSLQIVSEMLENQIESDDTFFNRIEFPAHCVVDFKRFKMLREIIIAGFKFPGGKLPKGITNLVHLRCLCLFECELDELPSSIRKLVYLENLDLRNSSITRLPNIWNKIFKLKHLMLPDYFNDEIGNLRLMLGEGLDELEMLLRFDTRAHELKSATVMKNLRQFSASVHDNESLAVIIEAISTNWNKLEFCMLTIGEGCELTENEEGLTMLEKLFRCPRISYLGITVKLGKLPNDSINNMVGSKLVELFLAGCEIEVDPMRLLGTLPSLRKLNIMWGSFVGEEMTCPASSFPHLEILRFWSLPLLKWWSVAGGAMPLLSELDISDCPYLEMVPDGLRGISTLKKITISGMPNLAKRVRPSGEDFHKVCHVPLITILD